MIQREIFEILIENRLENMIFAPNKEETAIAYGALTETCYIAYLADRITEKEYSFLRNAINAIYFESIK